MAVFDYFIVVALRRQRCISQFVYLVVWLLVARVLLLRWLRLWFGLLFLLNWVGCDWTYFIQSMDWTGNCQSDLATLDGIPPELQPWQPIYNTPTMTTDELTFFSFFSKCVCVHFLLLSEQQLTQPTNSNSVRWSCQHHCLRGRDAR